MFFVFSLNKILLFDFAVTQPIRCPEPSSVENAAIKVSDDIWNVNSNMFYSCNEGYTRQGPAIITCKLVDGEGEWSDNPPICELQSSGTKIN